MRSYHFGPGRLIKMDLPEDVGTGIGIRIEIAIDDRMSELRM
jgi:hypothetical protein